MRKRKIYRHIRTWFQQVHKKLLWHVVAVLYTGRRHVNPMMNLCKLLTRKKYDILITFVVPEEWISFVAFDAKPSNIKQQIVTLFSINIQHQVIFLLLLLQFNYINHFSIWFTYIDNYIQPFYFFFNWLQIIIPLKIIKYTTTSNNQVSQSLFTKKKTTSKVTRDKIMTWKANNGNFKSKIFHAG